MIDWFDCSGKEDGDYPHPSNPTKYISCVAHEYAYENDCPPGMQFDPGSGTCVQM
ncbi:carbohydrate-binding module family 14 protein [Nocardia sp. NPDC051052]|uniref:carbohydrate-binding module family 14 protein n=1 Tax=Nocardia sp. NPDC051052 TaxID=3364322 RepID=UPI0037B88C7F